jgi:mRNA-degrading endonuclease RelE of RelBE toxin-antitoxin system
MMPAFKRSYKKLHDNQKESVNKAVEDIKENPHIGQKKKGDLANVYVHKFDCIGQQMLLAYEYDPQTRVLLALSVHENFYRNLKK